MEGEGLLEGAFEFFRAAGGDFHDGAHGVAGVGGGVGTIHEVDALDLGGGDLFSRDIDEVAFAADDPEPVPVAHKQVVGGEGARFDSRTGSHGTRADANPERWWVTGNLPIITIPRNP